MTDPERDDLRATSSDIVADVQELAEIEKRKLRGDADPSALVTLSVEAEKLAKRVHKKAQAETEIAADLAKRSGAKQAR
ncbi:MAG: hypothetical protein ABI725_02525 [Chloroflexota bacterium]